MLDQPGSFPDEAIAHILHLGGVDTSVPHVVRIIGMATQKFVSDVGTSALHLSAERENLSLESSEPKLTLDRETLYEALKDYDDSMAIARRADYFA